MLDLNFKKLYKIEWNLNDNANAWIEPTTHCQLRCPKCFRNIGGEDYTPVHRKIEDIENEILLIKKKRNVESITIGGGEPLLYPEILKVVNICKINKIKVRICTNAIGLDEYFLKKLKKAGTNEVLIHLDKYQNRGTNEELFKIREKYCDIFRNVKGVNLGFMTMMYDVENDYIEELVDFYHRNIDVIILVSFIFTKEVFADNSIVYPETEKLNQLINILNKKYKAKPSAYIGKIISKDIPSWLIYLTLFFDTEPIGDIGFRIHELSSRYYRKIFKKHWFLTNKKTINFLKLLIFIFDKNIRKVLWVFVKKNIKFLFRKKLNYQIITVNFGPDMLDEGWDLCDSCPDAMIYNNKLVPSCLLERIKKGEKIPFNKNYE